MLAAFTPAETEHDKHIFVNNFVANTDGAIPVGGVVLKTLNVYGTTFAGGGTGCGGVGCGTVYEIPKDGTETVLYAFQGGTDGASPEGTIIERTQDAIANFYGTTSAGGGTGCGGGGCGTVFDVTDGTETVVYAFTGGSDGANPTAGFIMDKKKNLYSATVFGGTVNASCPSGCGTAFRMDPGPKPQPAVLYSFGGGSDGAYPYASLTMDAAGNLYGTTYSGGGTGCGGAGCGIVYKLSPPYGQLNETILYAFQGGSDGANPESSVVVDSTTNYIYGTTSAGGGKGCNGGGCGTVFELSPSAGPASGQLSETLLYAFQGGTDGANPASDTIIERTQDAIVNFYGTTAAGGGTGCNGSGCGTAYELSPPYGQSSETLLYAFTGGKDGANPSGNLAENQAGTAFFGTTELGGDVSCNAPAGCGTVYKLVGRR